MKMLNFAEVQNEIIQYLSEITEIVLATSYKEKVTARTVSCVCQDLTVYFLTSKAYTKSKQIEKNTNVAICVGNLQIEGTAVIKGHPLAEENQRYALIFQAKQKAFFEQYARYQNSILVEVTPTLLTTWKFAEGRHYREYLDLQKNTAYRKG